MLLCEFFRISRSAACRFYSLLVVAVVVVVVVVGAAVADTIETSIVELDVYFFKSMLTFGIITGYVIFVVVVLLDAFFDGCTCLDSVFGVAWTKFLDVPRTLSLS